MSRIEDWDPARYEGAHSFVWKHGEDALAWLDPQPEERILDLGCGTGHLTSRIAASGALVEGIDSSPSMIAQARQNYPNLKFQLADAQTFRTDTLFDAMFSNAALHWMPDHDAVSETVSRALKPDGRFVCELGAIGNVATIQAALITNIRNNFRSIAGLAQDLERHGLEVLEATIFDRPTKLEGGESGLREWIHTFRPDNKRRLSEVEDELRPVLFRDGHWTADYRRLRVLARKLA